MGGVITVMVGFLVLLMAKYKEQGLVLATYMVVMLTLHRFKKEISFLSSELDQLFDSRGTKLI